MKTADSRKIRVLVVDDEEPFLDLVRRQFAERPDLELLPARDGFETTSLLLTGATPDIIFMDIVMPGADGFALCRIVKNNVATAATPVILTTGKAEAAVRERYASVGAADYLLKPFGADRLFALIDRYVLGRTTPASGSVPAAEAGEPELTLDDVRDQLAQIERSVARQAAAATDAPGEKTEGPLSIREITALMAEFDPSTQSSLREFSGQGRRSSGRVQVSPDRMEVWLALQAPSPGQRISTEYEIRQLLTSNDVCAGILVEEIRAALAALERDRQRIEVVCARGTPPVHGRDARLVLDPALQIKEPERGRIVTPYVEADQRIGRYYDAEMGTDGCDVTGVALPATQPAILKFRFDRGVRVESDDDGPAVYANLTGYLHLDRDEVDVRELYTHEGDVDGRCGDIDFQGNCLITGSVRSGFSVHVSGQLEIQGSIEAADVETGGDLTVGGGVTGGERPASIRVGGAFQALFVENADVVAADDVTIGDAALNARISAGGAVTVTENRGRIIGGEMSGGIEIVCRDAGSPGEAETLLVAGERPFVRNSLRETEAELTALSGKLRIVQNLVTSMKKRGMTPEILHLMQENPVLADFLRDYHAMRTQFTDHARERERLRGELYYERPGEIRILGTAQPNVRVRIRGVTKILQNPETNVSFSLDRQGEIECV